MGGSARRGRCRSARAGSAGAWRSTTRDAPRTLRPVSSLRRGKALRPRSSTLAVATSVARLTRRASCGHAAVPDLEPGAWVVHRPNHRCEVRHHCSQRGQGSEGVPLLLGYGQRGGRLPRRRSKVGRTLRGTTTSTTLRRPRLSRTGACSGTPISTRRRTRKYRPTPASKNTFFAASITTFCFMPLTVQASCDHPFSPGPGFGGTGDAAQYSVQLVANNGACKTGNMVMYSYVPGTNQLFAVLSPATPGGAERTNPSNTSIGQGSRSILRTPSRSGTTTRSRMTALTSGP